MPPTPTGVGIIRASDTTRSRHADVEMVRRYIRRGQMFQENTADYQGL